MNRPGPAEGGDQPQAAVTGDERGPNQHARSGSAVSGASATRRCCSGCGRPLPDQSRVDSGISVGCALLRFGYDKMLAGAHFQLNAHIEPYAKQRGSEFVDECKGFTIEMPVTQEWQKNLTTSALEAWTVNQDGGWIYWQFPHTDWEIIPPDPVTYENSRSVNAAPTLRGVCSQAHPITHTAWLPPDPIEDTFAIFCPTTHNPPHHPTTTNHP